MDAFVCQEINVDRIVPADWLARKDSEAEAATPGLVVEKVEVGRGADQDDHEADLDDATGKLAVKFDLGKLEEFLFIILTSQWQIAAHLGGQWFLRLVSELN